MVETLQSIWDFAWPHWPAISFTIIMSILAQSTKTRLLTPMLAKQYAAIFWLRRTFPLLIILIGVLVGSIWPGEASPGVTERVHKIMYFTGCSAASIVLFNICKQWVKKKYDVDLGLDYENNKMD